MEERKMNEFNQSQARSYFNVMYYVFLILGIIYTASIAGAIIGIPMIMGACKYKEAYEASMDQLVALKGTIWGWGIFFGIVTLPLGIIIFIFGSSVNSFIDNYENGKFAQTNQNVTMPGQNNGYPQQNTYVGSDNNGTVQSQNQASFGQQVKDFSNRTVNGFKETFGIKHQSQKLEELKSMYNQGTITKEEYDALRKKTLGI